MIPGLTSVIIPTHAAHAFLLPEAVESALAQTAPVDVIVVHNGDGYEDTVAALCGFMPRAEVRLFSTTIPGPSHSRNVGIEEARGEYVQFLDADDLIEPNKVDIQRERLERDEALGWILSDTRIVDTSGRVELASKRYGYGGMELGGWIQHYLGARNFIPIHAPLVRRGLLLDGIRFDPTARPEDWHFWYAIAGVGRVSYVPLPLAVYRKQPKGRNVESKANTAPPGTVEPLRLNLGCGAPGQLSWHPMPGFLNMDKAMGWRFEEGLRDYRDGSIAGITISHALMYVAKKDWPYVFSEFARVLAPGGVVRITEDDTANKASRTHPLGWKGSDPTLVLTSPAIVVEHLARAGLRPVVQGPSSTEYCDASLVQSQHGDPPHVFFVEGVRDVTLLFSPHNDDEALFASFLICRHRPRVVVCFPSSGDYGDPKVREAETRAAVAILGGASVEQWTDAFPLTLEQLIDRMASLDRAYRPTRVFAPSTDASHPQHVSVGLAALKVFGSRLDAYQTYQQRDEGIYGQIPYKVRAGELVAFEPAWTERKRQALACYATQLAHPRAKIFFSWDDAEYLA